MKASWRSSSAALTLAFATLLGLVVVPVPAHAAPAGFVYRCGADFCVNGRTFRHVGVNTPQLVYQPIDQVRYTLDRLRNAGVKHVRVFLPDDAMQGNKYWPWETFNRLTAVLDEAQARGIYVTLALGQSYFQGVFGWEGRNGNMVVYGDRDFYTRWIPDGGGLYMLNDPWIDWGFQLNYRDWVWSFAARLKDHKAVFAYDIINEVNVSNTSNGWLVDRHVNFMRNIAGLIKGADPNHLVTTGLIHTGWAGYNDPQRDAVYNDPNIDYLVIHHYDNDSNRNFYDDVWRAHNRYRKPIIIEETGIAAAATNFQVMKDYFYQKYVNWQVDAIMQWAVEYGCPESGTSSASWGSGDNIYGPCQQNRIGDYEALWKYWSDRL